MEASFKILFTIRGSYTHESLSVHTYHFRPIISGATVPLKAAHTTGTSVADPWNFCTDPDPAIYASDL